MNKQRLIILCGLPASGKDIYAQMLIRNNDNIEHYSSDAIIKELYGDESIQGDPNKVFNIMRQRTIQALDDGKSVVYNATNVTRKNRKTIIDATSCFNIQKEIHIIWTPFEECVERDKHRERSVGEDVIRKFLYRWQSPHKSEGVDRVCNIQNVDVEFDWQHYRKCLLDNLDIPHDNPNHTLSVKGHIDACKQYAKTHFGDPIVWEAAALHDIAKPITKCYKSDENGKIIPRAHYFSHDNVGGYLVYGIYGDDPLKIATEVSWLVCNHMQPYFNSKYYKSLEGTRLRRRLDQLHEADLAAH